MADRGQFERAIDSAVRYLEDQLDVVSEPYALNIVSYALTLASSTHASRALNKLSALAISEGFYTLSWLSSSFPAYSCRLSLQCFDAVGRAAGRASGQ